MVTSWGVTTVEQMRAAIESLAADFVLQGFIEEFLLTTTVAQWRATNGVAVSIRP